MLLVAVVGSKGYIGSALYGELLRSSKYSVTGVTRENYSEMQNENFDILINSRDKLIDMIVKPERLWFRVIHIL